MDSKEKIDTELVAATELLKGKKFESILSNRTNELVIQFTDGTRLFVDIKNNVYEISIT